MIGKCLGNGLYEMSQDGMPGLPNGIEICRWVIRDTLGRMEIEEAAARLLHFSQEQGQWVAVSWSRIWQMIQADLAMAKDPSKAEELPISTVLLDHKGTGVVFGMRALAARKLVDVELSSDNEQVLTPKPELITRILEVQRAGIPS